jgi:hypothetical protein
LNVGSYTYVGRLLRRTKTWSGDEVVALLDAAVTFRQSSEVETDERLQAEVVV